MVVTRSADGGTMGIAGPAPPEYLADILKGTWLRRTKAPALHRTGRPSRVLPYGVPRRIVGMAWLKIEPGIVEHDGYCIQAARVRGGFAGE